MFLNILELEDIIWIVYSGEVLFKIKLCNANTGGETSLLFPRLEGKILQNDEILI